MATDLEDIPTPLEIPLALDTPLYDQRVTLDGVSYLMGFDYSGREDRWFLSLSTLDGVPLATGIKITGNSSLLERYRGREGYPKGILGAIDLSDKKGEAPGFGELGRRVKLFYFTFTAAVPPIVLLPLAPPS